MLISPFLPRTGPFLPVPRWGPANKLYTPILGIIRYSTSNGNLIWTGKNENFMNFPFKISPKRTPHPLFSFFSRLVNRAFRN